MKHTSLKKVVKVAAKVVSTLMAVAILYFLVADAVFAMRHPGYVRSITSAPGLRDALLVELMVAALVGMVLVWWRERAGAWVTIASLTATILAVWLVNGVPVTMLAPFFLMLLPAVLLLAVGRISARQGL